MSIKHDNQRSQKLTSLQTMINPSHFLDYKSLLQEVAEIDDKLGSTKASVHAPNTYDNLKISHVKFLQLPHLENNEEQRLITSNKRQMSMNDFFKQTNQIFSKVCNC